MMLSDQRFNTYHKLCGNEPMAFMHEIISDDEKGSIDFTKISSRFRVHSIPSHWVVDRVRGAFLVWLYPERDPPYEKNYALSVQSKIFNLAVVDTEAKKPNGKFTLVRKIIRLRAAGRSIANEELLDIVSLAKEALIVEAQRKESAFARNTDEIYVESEI